MEEQKVLENSQVLLVSTQSQRLFKHWKGVCVCMCLCVRMCIEMTLPAHHSLSRAIQEAYPSRMRLCKDWISTYFNSIHSSLKLFRSQIQRLPTSLPTVRILRHIQLLQGKSASLKRCASVPSMYHCLKCQPAPPICCLCSGTSPPSLQMIESFEATSTSTKFI